MQLVRGISRLAVGAVAVAVAGAVGMGGASAATTDCSGTAADIASASYTITHSSGAVQHVTELTGNVQAGDRISAKVTLTSSCSSSLVSLATYRTPSATYDPATVSQQTLYTFQTATVTGGQSVVLTATVPATPGTAGANCPNKHLTGPYPANGNGANKSGAYDSTCDGSPSGNGNGNGNANGKPCAGCVGNADNKNPPGQFPDGSDANAGYECDRNHGVGRTNPAHSGCASGTHWQVDLVVGQAYASPPPYGPLLYQAANG